MHLDYLDRIKGFAISLVVMGHVLIFCLHQGYPQKNYTLEWLYYFHMPLFAFISGYLYCVKTISFSKLLSKTKRLLVPFFFCGLIFTYIVKQLDVIAFMQHPYKLGYWYLFVLPILYFFFSLFRCFPLKNRCLAILLDLFVLFFFYIIFSIALYHIPVSIHGFLSSEPLMSIFLYFGLGVIIRKYDIWQMIIGNKCIGIVSAILYITIYVLFQNSSGAISIVGKSFAVIAYVCLFYHLREMNNGVTKYLEIMGKESLTIYVLHYFVFNLFPFWSYFRVTENTYKWEWLISLVFAVVIVYISFCIGWLLKKNRYISFCLTGKYSSVSTK